MNHLFKRCTLILVIVFSVQINAQKSLSDSKTELLLQKLHLPKLDSLLLIKEPVDLRNLWYHSIKKNIEDIKNKELLKLFQKIEKLAVEKENPGLEMHAGLWQYFIERENSNSEYDFNTKLEKIAKKATNSNVLWFEITAKYRYAVFLVTSQKSIENVEKGIWIIRENIDKIHESQDISLTKWLVEHYRILTQYYYEMDDISNSILYSVKALNIEFPKGSKLIPSDNVLYKNMNNNLGVYYREQQKLDSSTYYFERIYKIPLTKNSSQRDSLYRAISGGNLGENLYLQQNYAQALPLLQIDADANTKINNWGNVSNALILIADIHLRDGNFKKAKQTLEKATYAAHSSNQIKRLSKLYPVLSKYYKSIGKPNTALIYADSTFMALDSLKRKNNLFRVTKAEESYNKYQLKLAAEKELEIKNRNIKKRNIGLFILFLLLLLGYYIFRKTKLKAKKQESKLENKMEQVIDKLSIKESQLKTKIEEINAKKNAVNWREFKINSDEQSERFLVLFENEYPNFIKNIKSKFPKITAGETRLFCLIRLGLDDVAKASILGVNVNSVSQTRRRFMRKSNIESLSELKELIFNI